MDYNNTDDREEIKRKNVELLLKVVDRCNKKSRQDVWLLLGLPGAGKSMMINTLIAVLTGTYYHRATAGSGIAATRTITLQRYENCGVLNDDFENEFHRDVVKPVMGKLPTIYDAAGKGDVNTEALQEILEMVILGFIPPQTAVSFLEEHQEKRGVGCLKKMYKVSKPEWRVTKIVFVQPCNAEVPANLAACLQSVLMKTNPKTGMLLCNCEVFVVMSKYDLVQDKVDDDRKGVSIESMKRREKAVAANFNLEGAMKHNSIRWVSYVDDNGEDNPYIDHCALEFLMKLLKHGSVPQRDDGPTVTPVLPSQIGNYKVVALLVLFLAFAFSFILKKLIAPV